MTPNVFLATSKQVQEYLLCNECEHLLHKNGENYTLPLLNRSAGDFPLLTKLKRTRPLGKTESGGDVFSAGAACVDTLKLAYFGLSIFWKASVHTWPTLSGQFTAISLGSQQEDIRKFLHEESGFPPRIVLRLEVCGDAFSQDHVFGPVTWQNDLYTGHSYAVFGLLFDLILDVKGGAQEWNLCCVNTPERRVFVVDCSRTTTALYSDIRKNAKIPSNLRKQ